MGLNALCTVSVCHSLFQLLRMWVCVHSTYWLIHTLARYLTLVRSDIEFFFNMTIQFLDCHDILHQNEMQDVIIIS